MGKHRTDPTDDDVIGRAADFMARWKLSTWYICLCLTAILVLMLAGMSGTHEIDGMRP